MQCESSHLWLGVSVSPRHNISVNSEIGHFAQREFYQPKKWSTVEYFASIKL